MDPALEKLRAALEEYLAQGGDTPVAPEAQALMQAITGAGDAGGMADQGGMAPPPDMGAASGPPDPMAANLYPGGGGDPGPGLQDLGAPQDQTMPPPQNAKTFEGARAGAKDRLKKLKAKA